MNNLYIRQDHKIFKSDAVVFSSIHDVAQFRLFPYVLPLQARVPQDIKNLHWIGAGIICF